MKRIPYFLMISFCALLISRASYSATLKLASTPEPPVNLEKGWNLISVPCDVAASDLIKGGTVSFAEKKGDNGNAGNDNAKNESADVAADNAPSGNGGGSIEASENGANATTKFFSWNGEGYDEVAYLYRGVGYIVNTNNIQNTSAVCDQAEVAEPMTITLKEGWNLVGNPYHKSYKIEDVFGAASSMISLIYEYSGNKYSELKPSEHFKPWRGYWAYVEEDVSVPVFTKCYVTISAENMEVGVGKSVSVEVLYSCESEAGVVESYDVTDEAEWSVTGGGKIENGEFMRRANREIKVTARYKELTSNELSFATVDFKCGKVVVVQVYEEQANEDGYCGNYAKKTGVSPYRGEQCRQCGDGSDIVCVMNNSNSPAANYVYLWHYAGKIKLKAYCVGDAEESVTDKDGRTEDRYVDYMDVTADSKWKTQDDNKLKVVENGDVYGAGNGVGTVTADYEGKKSLQQEIVIVDIEKINGIFFSSPKIVMGYNSEKENILYSTQYKSPNGDCAENAVSSVSGYCYRDISSKAKYAIKGGDVIFEKGLVKSKTTPGDSYVEASYGSLKTSMKVTVVDQNQLINIGFYPGPNIDMFTNSVKESRLYGLYKKFDDKCESEVEKYFKCEYRIKDITDIGEYAVFYNSVTYKDGVVTSSSGTGVARVNAYYNGKSANLNVQVFNPESPIIMYFTPPSIKMYFDEEKETRVMGLFYNAESDCAGSNCKYKELDLTDKASYMFSDKSAKLSYEDGIVRVVGGVSGRASITASYGGCSARLEALAVDRDEVAGLTLKPSSLSMFPGNKTKVVAYANYYTLSDYCFSGYGKCAYEQKDVTGEAMFESANDKATYEDNYVIAGSAQGSGRITVAYGGKRANIDVVVKDPNELLDIAFDTPNLNMAVNQDTKIKLIGKYYDAEKECVSGYCYKYEDITKNASYSISSSAVSFKDGIVKSGSSDGIARIDASLGGKTAKMIVTVVDVSVVQKVEFKNTTIYISVGESANFSVSGEYINTSCWTDEASTHHYCGSTTLTNITSMASYEYDERFMTVTDGTIKAGNKTATVKLTAKFQGKEDTIMIYILGDDLMRLTINGPTINQVPRCPASSYCFITDVSQKLKLGAFAFYINASAQSKDLTELVSWEISDSLKATIDSTGTLTPTGSGMIWIRASYKDARSEKVWIAIADDQNNRFLIAGLGYARNNPLFVGHSRSIYTDVYTYDKDEAYKRISLEKHVTADNIVLSNANLVSYQKTAGDLSLGGAQIYVITARYTGVEEAYMEYEGMKSNTFSFDVWKDQDMDRCDSSNPNMTVWEDNSTTRATLETDCSTYSSNEDVSIVYTAETGDGWLVDNCLDLWVIDENDKIVKTFRVEGCSTESIGRSSAAKTMKKVFQTKYVWDMIGDDGKKVPPGNYYATARFYIIYEPVIHTAFTIK